MDINAWASRLVTAVRRATPQSHLPPEVSLLTPTWNTQPGWLVELAESVLAQTFTRWEWCIVDDGSTETDFHALFPILERLPHVKIARSDLSLGISGATNRALAVASGEWIACVDHDDLLTADALHEMAQYFSAEFDAVYSDSDKIDEAGVAREPFYKPDWSPAFFRGVMYVGHLLCVRRSLAEAVDGFRSEFDGIQDYDFLLRISERTRRIEHVSKILYHWRAVPGSIAADIGAKQNIEALQCRAVQEHLDRLDMDATAISGHFRHRVRVQPKPRHDYPKISIIIPTKDSPELITNCLRSVFSATTYPNFEVICMDNGTTDREALAIMEVFPVIRVEWPGVFNFSKVNNAGAARSTGEFLVFLNNDIEVITPDWLEQMLFNAERDDVAAVGALLLYPDRSIQHAGVVLGCRGTADHVLRGAPGSCDGYAGSVSCAREVSAVTAACLMIRKSLFFEIQGFDEHFFTAYQDVDLCLKLRRLGKRNIYTPGAVLVHHESASRGSYYDFVDRNLLLDRWEEVIEPGDPYYNRHFDVRACDYGLDPVPKSDTLRRRWVRPNSYFMTTAKK